MTTHLPTIAILLIGLPLAVGVIWTSIRNAAPLIAQLNRQWKEWDT